MCAIDIGNFPRYKEGKLPARFEKTVREVVNRVLELQLPNVEAIALFGSAARGIVKSTSDIDIWVVLNEPITSRELASELRECEDGLSCKVDILLKTLESVDTTAVFDRNLLRDSKLVWRKE